MTTGMVKLKFILDAESDCCLSRQRDVEADSDFCLETIWRLCWWYRWLGEGEGDQVAVRDCCLISRAEQAEAGEANGLKSKF